MNSGERGVSSVVGYALLLVIVSFGIVSVVALGGAAMTDIQQSTQADQASVAMSQFDAEAAQVAIGESQARSVDLGSGDGSVSVDGDAGSVTITHVRPSNPDVDILPERSLGTVVYDTGDGRVAYQGGGVWRTEGDETRMVSPPEYHFRGETLTFPVVRVTGEWSGSPGQGLRIREGSETQIYPSATHENPLEDGHIEVEVTSEHHAGWAEYFRSRTDGSVSHFPASERVVVDLTVPYQVEFTNGVAVTDSGGNAIQTNGGGEFTGPQRTGSDHPTADDRIDDRISDCESGGCEDLSTALSNGPLTNGTYYHDGDKELTSTEYDTSDGPVHVVVDGDLTFKGNGGPGTNDHVVTGGDQVRFYVKGDLEISGNGAVNTGGDPDDVLALVHSDAASVSAASGTVQFTGYIYAPGTDFTINGGGSCGTDCDGNVVGGVVAKSATASGNGKLQYEEPAFSFDMASGTAVTYVHISERTIKVDGAS